MSEIDFAKIATNLVKVASMTADESSAKRGEDDFVTKIKRNSEKLNSCSNHYFDPDPNWRESAVFSRRTVHCRNCDGDMKAGDAMIYLKGFAHGSGMNYNQMINRVWPPKVES